MVTLEKVTVDSFEKVFPLFEDSSELIIPKKYFQRLFTKYWDEQEDCLGYMLVNEDKVVGYLGYIFSKRMCNNKSYKFCNLTSWNVKPEFRRYSLELLRPILKDHECTITTFTGGKVTKMVLKQSGFDVFEDQIQVIPFCFNLNLFSYPCQIIYDHQQIKAKLDGEDLDCFINHQHFECKHILIESAEEQCYLIIKRTKKKHLPFAFIHYLSDVDYFSRNMLKVNASICFKMKVLGIIMYKVVLKGAKLRPSFTVNLPSPGLFRSTLLTKQDIDSLYSEFFLLNSP